MVAVESVLMILILLADPSLEPDALRLQEQLQRGSQNVEIKLGKAAHAHLEKDGVNAIDLLADPSMGRLYTKFNDRVVIVHLDGRTIQNDRTFEAKLWLEGRSDGFISIAGEDGDPLPAMAQGLRKLIKPLIRNTKQGPATVDPRKVAHLVEQQSWQPLLGVLAGITEKTEREHYYEVLAYVRLGQRDGAVAALNSFRNKYPNHFLFKAAEALVPELNEVPEVVEGLQESDGLPELGVQKKEFSEEIELQVPEHLRGVLNTDGTVNKEAEQKMIQEKDRQEVQEEVQEEVLEKAAAE